MKRIVYLAIDAHSKTCTSGVMDARGKMIGMTTYPTSEANLTEAMQVYKDCCVRAVVEESSLASWVAQTVNPYCDSVTVANPMHNRLISTHANKCDQTDVESLCTLLRLGAIKSIYRPGDDDRAVFKTMVQHYHDMTKREVELKQQVKAKYLQYGIVDTAGTKVLSVRHRDKYLVRLTSAPVKRQLERLYALLDLSLEVQSAALADAWAFGTTRYPEISEFMKIPGIGKVGALTFDSFIYTPDRFTSRSALYRYCRLGVRSRSSDGKPLSYKRLDRCGNPELKALSYRAWLTAMRVKSSCVVRDYYEESLGRTRNHVHARLNTQRKVISILYGVWKSGEPYRPELFLGSDKLAA